MIFRDGELLFVRIALLLDLVTALCDDVAMLLSSTPARTDSSSDHLFVCAGVGV